jgi:hypothetical protein
MANPETITVQVAASEDDCRVCDAKAPPHVWTWISTTEDHHAAGFNYISKVYEGGGMRFRNIPIPKGAIINSAYLKLTAKWSISGVVVRTKIQGEAVDNASPFSNLSNYNGRARTNATVRWDNIPAWAAGTEYTSPDISAIIQEIVNRDGWSPGNALVLFWEDDGSDTGSETRRAALSYDGSPANAPKLEITYTPPEVVPPAPPDVKLEVLSLPDLTPILTDNLTFCTPSPDYELDPGNYRVRGTATATGAVREKDVTITEGMVTAVDLDFAVYHTLIITATAGGTTNPAPGRYEIKEGTSVTVTALPDESYRFNHWELDGAIRTENPITIIMDRAYSLHAVFEYVPPPPVTCTIKGVVKDAPTGTPIAGATVTCNGYAAITEIDGSYEFRDIPTGVYTLSASAAGYITQAKTVDASTPGTYTVDFALERVAPPTPPTVLPIQAPITVGLILLMGAILGRG